MTDPKVSESARLLRNKGYEKLKENLALKGKTLSDHFRELAKKSHSKDENLQG